MGAATVLKNKVFFFFYWWAGWVELCGGINFNELLFRDLHAARCCARWRYD